MNYQRVGQLTISPLLFKTDIPAFDLARLFYSQYSDLNFEDDLLDYLRTGFVCSRPNLFAMVKVVNHEGENMWYIRIAVGHLLELLSVLPFPLDKLCFCRNNRANEMRIVSRHRLTKLAIRQWKKENRNVSSTMPTNFN